MNKRILNQRLSKARKIGKVLATLPFVCSVILNGSLAQGKSKESSDIDILIIARSGRIFTARFFVNTLTTTLGVKRSKDDSKGHAGKFCFNYFLSDNFLTIPTGRGEKIDRYCAENYSASKFIAGDKGSFHQFMKTNEKLFAQYNCHPKVNIKYDELQLKMADGRLGNWFEQIVKKYQIKKIMGDKRTQKYPNLIVFNDKELRFHPPKQP